MIAAALREAALDAVTVTDGAAALVQCQRRDPGVIVLDLALPGLGGREFADAYRNIPESRARIIVIGGTERGGETAAKMRSNVYFSKPLRLDSLVDATMRLLTETS